MSKRAIELPPHLHWRLLESTLECVCVGSMWVYATSLSSTSYMFTVCEVIVSGRASFDQQYCIDLDHTAELFYYWMWVPVHLPILTFFRLQSRDLHALFVLFPCDSPNATRDTGWTACPAIRLGTKGGGAGASADVPVIAFPRSQAVFSVPPVPVWLHTDQLVLLPNGAGHLSFRCFLERYRVLFFFCVGGGRWLFLSL